MDENQPIPKLLDFYFGDSATCAHHAASRRLRKWSRAFDSWIEQRQGDYHKDTVKHILLAWRRLVRQGSKLPWQLTPDDIDHHVTWLRQEGFAEPTINGSIGFISSFYQWVDQQRLDPACPAGFNPVKEAVRSRLSLYQGVILWNLGEVEAFLSFLSRDKTVLGKRDYAFFLARLNLGVPLKSLQHLEWSQIQQQGSGAQVQWQLDGRWVQLPDLVWYSLVDYLQASGRLAGMSSGKFIFAPQVQPVLEGSGSRVEDWLETHHLSSSTLHRILKLYGRQVGIAEARLNFAALRWTAIRLRLDQGETLEGMQSFLDTRELRKSTRFRLARLPSLSDENTIDPSRQVQDLPLPVRISKPLDGDEGTTHGFYSSRKDMQAVRAIMVEDIEGLEQGTACLRQLMRGLLEMDGSEAPRIEAYSQAAHRLGMLLSAGEEKRTGSEDNSAEESLRRLDEYFISEGKPPISPVVRQKALGSSSELAGAFGKLTEEIAALRLMLRNIYQHALLKSGTREYIHLINLYGLGCVRLARLLKLEAGDANQRLENYMRAAADEAIRQVHQELRGDRGKM